MSTSEIDYYALYAKDQPAPEHYSTRPKRRKPCKFGTNFRIDIFGQFLRQQNDIIDWNLRRRYYHQRDQFSFASKRYDKTNWGVPVSQSARIDAAHNFYARGGKSITFTIFNFTLEALAAAPAHIVSAYLARYNRDKDKAAKAILHAGCAAGDPSMVKFAKAHAAEMMERLAPLKGTPTRLERENELRWQQTSAWNRVTSPTRTSNYDFAKSVGWEPVDEDPLAFIDPLIVAEGWELAPQVDVHAYHAWLVLGEQDTEPRNPDDQEDRMTQSYLGYEWEGPVAPEPFEVREAQGTRMMPAGEIMRVCADVYARGASIIYNHTAALLGAALYYYNDRWMFYEPYRSPEAAKALLKKLGNPIPMHEGRCVLDPAADHAWNITTEFLSYGEAA
jgi:hypothetical protein